MRRSLDFILVMLAMALVTAGCGGTSNPAAPSSSTSATPGTAAGSATITGAVQGAAVSSVGVVGTSLAASVDAGGRFALAGVPAGDVQLQVSGGGANAMLAVTAVQPAQKIELVVAVSGSTASIESQVRSGASDAELEGRVESLPPTTPASTFKAAGRTVTTNSSTRFQDGGQERAFADLKIGMRVHVKGAPVADGIGATLVEMQNSQVDVPVEVNGIVEALTGSAAAFQLNVGNRLVKGDANTTFFGDGDKPDTFADLKNGKRVEIKGQQRDGFVYATRLHINDDDGADDDDPPQDTSASIQGVLKSIGGAGQALVLTVNSTTVRTSSATTVKRRGDVQTLSALKVGQTLHVVGTRQPDGSIDARLIEIDDDATGGEFEIQGSLGGLKGTCPAISFGVNGFSVTTSSATVFDGVSCTALKSGDKIEVKGTRNGDGSVAATRVKRNS